MALTINLLGGTTYAAAYGFLWRYFQRSRLAWRELRAVAPQARAIIDTSRREALAQVFSIYEEDRQVVAHVVQEDAVKGLPIPEVELELSQDPDLEDLRLRIKQCMRDTDDATAERASEKARESSALAIARYGPAFETAAAGRHRALRARIKTVMGFTATGLGLASLLASPSFALLFLLKEAGHVTLPDPLSKLTSFTLVAVAWGTLLLLLFMGVVLHELSFQPKRQEAENANEA